MADKNNAPQWEVYKTEAWGRSVLMGRVRAHTKEGAANTADSRRKFKGWDEIKRLLPAPNGETPDA